MIKWFWIFAGLFITLLVAVSTRAIKRNKSINDFMLAGSSLGAILGILTYVAALFSAFIFIGIPDFFRVHGVGAWIFLAVADTVMFFIIFSDCDAMAPYSLNLVRSSNMNSRGIPEEAMESMCIRAKGRLLSIDLLADLYLLEG